MFPDIHQMSQDIHQMSQDIYQMSAEIYKMSQDIHQMCETFVKSFLLRIFVLVFRLITYEIYIFTSSLIY